MIVGASPKDKENVNTLELRKSIMDINNIYW